MFIAGCLGEAMAERRMRQLTIDAGCGYYEAKTGKFKFGRLND